MLESGRFWKVSEGTAFGRRDLLRRGTMSGASLSTPRRGLVVDFLTPIAIRGAARMGVPFPGPGREFPRRLKATW
jgi:hypothetical protein